MRKSIILIARLCEKHNISRWRQNSYNLNNVRRLYRMAQKSKLGKSKSETSKQSKIQKAHSRYIELCKKYLERVKNSCKELEAICDQMLDVLALSEISDFIVHAERQIDQIERRVLNGEVIPHKEKVFSIFEPYTEWINKGKAGVPVELGLRVCIVENHAQFLLHHKVMEKITDEKIAIEMAEEVKKRFPDIDSMSYDRGFYSATNREKLGKIVNESALPKKGKRSKRDQEIEKSGSFLNAKRKHSAVESAINALEHHGLDRCRDKGIKGFKRYVALSIVAKNIQRIGAILTKKEKRILDLRRRRMLKKAA